MKSVKNAFVGFFVSFIGSLPLGYLNIFGYEIYSQSGMERLIPYLLGVLIVEAVVIYGTFVFASALATKRKLLQYIEFFSIFFMLALAYVFYESANATVMEQSTSYFGMPAFVIGIILSCLNFIQIPFWISWNLYLVGNGYVNTGNYNRYTYLIGTLAGTFCGMLTLVLSLDFAIGQPGNWTKYIMSHFIPAVFLCMAIYQAFKFWKKYYGATTIKK